MPDTALEDILRQYSISRNSVLPKGHQARPAQSCQASKACPHKVYSFANVEVSDGGGSEARICNRAPPAAIRSSEKLGKFMALQECSIVQSIASDESGPLKRLTPTPLQVLESGSRPQLG